MMSRSSKTNVHGKRQYASFMRHKEILVSPVFTLSAYLFCQCVPHTNADNAHGRRFQHHRDSFPHTDLSFPSLAELSPWYNPPLLSPQSRGRCEGRYSIYHQSTGRYTTIFQTDAFKDFEVFALRLSRQNAVSIDQRIKDALPVLAEQLSGLLGQHEKSISSLGQRVDEGFNLVTSNLDAASQRILSSTRTILSTPIPVPRLRSPSLLLCSSLYPASRSTSIRPPLRTVRLMLLRRLAPSRPDQAHLDRAAIP